MKKKWLLVGLLVVVLAGFSIAATTWDMSYPRFDRLWVGSSSDTPSETFGDNAAYIKGILEVDGAAYFDGAVDFDSTVDFSGATLTFSAGQITATNIANVSRDIRMPLADFFIVGTGVMGNDGTTAPGLATTDEAVKVVWASSAEAASIQYTFEVPSDYSSGLQFRIMASSSTDTGATTSWGFDWTIVSNTSGTAFGSVIAQDSVTNTEASPSTINAVITLEPDATGEAAISANSVLTIGIFPYDVRESGTSEILNIVGRYTAVQ